LDTGSLNILLNVAFKSHPELTKFPLAGDLVKNDEGRKLLQAVVFAHGASVRPFVLPPNTPKDRAQALRKAFADTMNDPDFLAEAKKGNLEVNPLTGEELAKSVQAVLQTEPALAGKLKEILK
jgi:hypothetical protein